MEERIIPIRSIYRYIAQIRVDIFQNTTNNLYIFPFIVLVSCRCICLRFPNEHIDVSIRISSRLFLLRTR